LLRAEKRGRTAEEQKKILFRVIEAQERAEKQKNRRSPCSAQRSAGEKQREQKKRRRAEEQKA